MCRNEFCYNLFFPFIQTAPICLNTFVMIYVSKLSVCQVLGFGEYIEDVYAAYEQHKLETMVMAHYFMLFFYPFIIIFIHAYLLHRNGKNRVLVGFLFFIH